MLILDTVGDTIKAEASAASSLTVTAYGIEISSGAETYKKLGQAQLTGSGTQDTIYTVPASTSTICSNMVIANTSASERSINLWHIPNGGSYGDDNAILKTVAIPANTTIVWNKGNIQMFPNPGTYLSDIIGLAKTDGNFIVGNGTNWVAESGNTARTSLGLGTEDSPEFTDLTLNTPSNIYALSHDLFANFEADEHFVQTSITNVSSALSTGLVKVTTGTGALSVIADSSSNWDTAYSHSQLTSGNPHQVTPTELSLVIGTNTQAHGDVLDDLNTLDTAASDGQFIVATGAGAFAYESGATARTSLGLGNVENTALSTWAGSANITTLGTISTVGNITIADGGTIGQVDGALLTFNDTDNNFSLTNAKFGIGTLDPDTAIDILHSTPDITLRNNLNADTHLARRSGIKCYGLQSGNESSVLGYMSFAHDASGDDQKGRMDIYTNSGVDDDSPTHQFCILSSGRIGFGTTNPQEKLHVEHATWNTLAYFKSGDANCHFKIADPTSSVYVGTDTGVFFINNSGVATTGLTYNPSTNLFGINEHSPVTSVELSHTEPYFTLHNSTEEDADGGRESRIIARGEQSGGEESILGYLEFSHDGASDDEKGQCKIYLNDGNDGTSPSITGLRINADGVFNTMNHYPLTDNTYYLGKNDDDTPFAWKGIILKDQGGTGKYYRLEVNGDALQIVDLTD